jgi:polar amino acid transport system substrate-binding protein
LIWLLLFSLPVSASENKDALAIEKTLRLYVPYLCPLVCDQEIEGRSGYVVEILESIFSQHGIQLDFRQIPWQRAMDMAMEGKNDALVGIFKMSAEEEKTWAEMGIQTEAYKALIYPRETIFSWNEACFFVSSDSSWQYENDESFTGLRFGTIRGYSYTALDQYLENFPQQDDRISGEDLYRRNFLRLNSARIDLAVGNPYMARVVLNRMFKTGQLTQGSIRFEGCYPNSTSRDSYIVFSPKHPNANQLSQQFDMGLKRLRESGQLEKILSNYDLKDWQD